MIGLGSGRHTLQRKVRRRLRECDLYAPEVVKVTPDKKQRVGLAAFDGVIRSHQPPNRMADQYGLLKIAKDCGLFLLHPQADSPLWGMRQAGVRGWSTHGSLVRCGPYDDGELVVDFIKEASGEFGIELWYGAGFSSGAHFVHLLAKRYECLFKGIIAVGGTIFEKQAVPKGTHIIVFHGDEDLRLPFKGGWSRGFRRWLESLYAIGPKIFGSRPWRQFVAYALANGLDPEKAFKKTIAKVIEKMDLSTNELIIIQYLLKGLDHDWHAKYVNRLWVKAFRLHRLVVES